MVGQQVFSDQIVSTNLFINSNSWEKGVFLVRFTGSKGTELRKIIVN
jgi:hypothetical protein